MTKLTYRPEIDCLRAIAVGAVIIYHAKIHLDAAHITLSGAKFFGNIIYENNWFNLK